jgi:hydroxymethylglutaryl-CoA lyase
MTGPEVHRRPGLPERVSVYEVGARDGLQNEPTTLPAAVKIEFISRLVDAGLRAVEATSFVSPKWVPQLGDAAEVFAALPRVDGVRYPVLVPNMPGLDRAQEAGATCIAIFAAATETFSRRNLNRGLDEALSIFAPVVERARSSGMWVRAYLSMCFGDPWEGAVPQEQVVEVAERLVAMDCNELSVADTIGVATPGHVHELLAALNDAGMPPESLAVHFHDTYGQALSNTLAAIEDGVRTVDSAAGGLGGCPFAESTTGNLATEDLVWMLHGLGIETGVDLAGLVATSAWLAGELGRASPSRVVRALAN